MLYRTAVRYAVGMTTHTFTAMTIKSAAEAGMTSEEYRSFIQSTRGRGLTVPTNTAQLPADGPGYTEVAEGNYKRPSEPHDGPTKSFEERLAEVCDWLLTLDRKVEVRDIDHIRGRVAKGWLRRYQGDFQFLTDLKARGGVRSDAQAKGVLNCLRAELLRRPAPAATPAAPAAEGISVHGIEPGRYAYQPDDGQAQFLIIERPEDGNYAGCTFVKAQLGPNVEKAGWQGARHATYRGSHVNALKVIMADPEAAMRLYGHLLGHCGACGLPLTNEESREAGIGPVCRRNRGW